MTEPGLFDQDEDGLVVLQESETVPVLLGTAREAARLCPASVITLHEA